MALAPFDGSLPNHEVAREPGLGKYAIAELRRKLGVRPPAGEPGPGARGT